MTKVSQATRDKLSAALKGRAPSPQCMEAAKAAKRAKAAARKAAGVKLTRSQRGPKTPPWVPDEYVREFKELLRRTGCEIEACSVMRRVLAESRAEL